MITVTANQSLLDLAIATYGSAEAAVWLAVKNGLSITATLSPGQQLLPLVDYEADASNEQAVLVRAITPQPYVVQARQSLMDVSMQLGGDAGLAVELAIMNDITLSDELAVGMELKVTGLPVAAKSITSYYLRHGIVPATGVATVAPVEPPSGATFYLLTDDGRILLTDDNRRLTYE